ncbi:MAG: hypothetical protein Q9191_007641 [Dirinaria sp. TL-2023a]
MPRGFKIVDWTDPSNDAKLLVSVLKHVEINKHYEDIAKDFGENVPVQCIQLRVSKIKRNVKDGKLPASASKTSTVKATTTSNKGKVGGRGKKATTNDSGDESMNDDEMNASQSMTPPKTPVGTAANKKTVSGHVTKPRASPRKKVKKEDKKTADSFMDIKDVKDENDKTMAHTEKSESDLSPTDVEFGQERGVKVERADDHI